MIGLNIKIPNKSERYLYYIFKNIDLSNYIFKVFDEEILYIEDGKEKNKLFLKDIFCGKEFTDCISFDSYYIIFLDIKAYLSKTDICDIATYNDFKKSKCEMIFLCSDCTFIDFYCKNEIILNAVLNNCIEFGFDVDIIEENNDSRHKMSVL